MNRLERRNLYAIRKRQWLLPLIILVLSGEGGLTVNGHSPSLLTIKITLLGMWAVAMRSEFRALTMLARAARSGGGRMNWWSAGSYYSPLRMFSTARRPWIATAQLSAPDAWSALVIGTTRSHSATPGISSVRRRITGVAITIPDAAARACPELLVHPASDRGVAGEGVTGFRRQIFESSDLNESYGVWVPESSADIAAWQIFDPELIIALVDNPGTFWEQRGTMLFVYALGWPSNADVFATLLENAREIRAAYVRLAQSAPHANDPEHGSAAAA